MQRPRSALRLKFAFAGSLRKHFVEKFIAVFGDRLCPLRFARVAEVTPDVIALQFATGALRSIRLRRSNTTVSNRKEFARPDAAVLLRNTSCCFAYYVQCC
jgi:hypothetical protein